MKKDSLNGAIHFYLAVLVMLTYPFSIKVSSTMVGIWAFHWLIMLFLGRLEKPKWSWLLLMIAFPLMYAVSLTYSSNLVYGIHSIERRISLFLIPCILCTVSIWDKDLRDRFFLYSYFGALLAAFVCICVAAYDYFVHGTNHFYWTELTNPLSFHPGYFSFYISVLLFWFMRHLRTTWTTQPRSFIVAALLSIIFLSCFMVLLASRVQLSLFYCTLFFLSYYYAREMGWKFKLGLLFFLVISIYFISTTYIRDRIRNISSITYQLNDPPEKFNELTIRLALLECSSQVIREHWLLGVGAGDNYDELDKVYRKVDYQFGYGDHQDPHNEYVNTMVSLGVVGLLLLLGTFGLSLYLALKRKDAIHLLFILFFMIGCLFESMLSQQKGIVLFSIFNSLFVFHGARKSV